ncbi:SAM-dependent methyltransferase [Nitratiruptor sp. SB155-2]|uniref:SAM-dependent methyltransferase n=1 Tax=Nitratiruptor sp. (strain SB155-2) TaxID=387092 RepID=UPI0001587204|nr:RsmB/NOP family class I SAM-dependent RNA methyltransferase [Nitratiruptor sp. SB155-2]BAF69790.1 tRNA/rRNA cytosine-C5-methylase, NOL1/NOP2/Sun family [Nitratiruptor sp. SB155-2]
MNQKIFEERIRKIEPSILELLHTKKSFSFRINHHRASTQEAIELLEQEGYHPRKVEWANDVFELPIEHRKSIVKSSAYTQNMIYIQNLSSIFSAYSIDIDPEDWVLDLAAAPGGKSLIFSERAKKVSAVEPDKGRFFRMKRNFKEHMAKNIQTYNKDGRFIYKSCPGWFDKVFLDAPCSSEAHIDGEVTWWNVRRVRKFAKLQKELIVSAYESLKPGGQMIYSTCTFAPEENEAVVDFLIKKYPEAQVMEVEVPFSNWMRGLSEWEEKEFHPDVAKTVRILPKGAYSGFFMAKIMKNL